MIRTLFALAALVLIPVPSAAMAQELKTNAPPGNSAIDQYLETIPEASGNRSSRAGGSPGGGLTPAQRAKLQRRGADGKALADVVDATAPPAATRRDDVAPHGSSDGRSPVAQILNAVTGQGGGGMGALLPTILLATLLGAIALTAFRRRSSGNS